MPRIFDPILVIIKHTGDLGEVVGQLPEEFSLDVGSDWQVPWASSGVGVADVIAQKVGLSMKIEKVMRNFWAGSSPIDFSIAFELWARSSGLTEVIEPVERLQKMALPYMYGTKILKAPEPVLISIGRVFILDEEFYVKKVDTTFKRPIGIDGYPQRAIVTVGLVASGIVPRQHWRIGGSIE